MPPLAARKLETEEMDRPGLNASAHRLALGGLARLNWWSRTANVLWARMAQIAASRGSKPLIVLDLACGGGDVGLRLAALARRSRVPLRLTGWDISDTAVAYARSAATRQGLPDVEFQQRDALQNDLGDAFDVIYCTLFLHHLARGDAIELLGRMSQAARCAVLVDDLRRTTAGYWLAWAACRILSRSSIVHNDGPQSVQAAFTEREALQLAAAAGWQSATLTRHWPQRFLLQWCRT